MTNNGFVKIWRRIKDDPEIWDTGKPFDERSAFLYLLIQADWKTGVIPYRLTERYLAQVWHWSKSKVHRYIGFLKSVNKLVEGGPESGPESGPRFGPKISRLKISKWDSYQREQVKSGPRFGPTSGPESGPLRKEGFKEGLKKKDLVETPKTKTDVSTDISSHSSNLKDTQPHPKSSAKRNPIEEILSIWCYLYEQAYGFPYPGTKARDCKLIKDRLNYANQNTLIPPDCKLLFLVATMEEFLDNGNGDRSNIPAWSFAFEDIITDFDWDNVNWGKMEEEYVSIQTEKQNA